MIYVFIIRQRKFPKQGGSLQGWGIKSKNSLWGEGNLKQHAHLDTFIFDKMLKSPYLNSH